ncbi:hypothetical protein [Terrisporobacter sp.]|uniref:hypothetical protein n=1 Tax=Terrisporobacter sp. TaxID=1965305 RepID=UPI0028991532|nr:hypothetical protein [Terrisporobacter sp.]
MAEILESLNIDVAFMEYEGNNSEYIIFSIYDEREEDFTDDKNDSEVFYIDIKYWFKDKTKINNYKKIKSLLKSEGFIFDGAKDLKTNNYYGKSLDFIYEKNTEEE